MKKAIYFILAFALCSCAVLRTTTSEEFAKDVQKDIPFKVSDHRLLLNVSNAIKGRSELSVVTLKT